MVKLVSNKGGWLRVLEASIAILIVLSVLFVVTKQNNVQSSSPYGGDLGILGQIALNESIRNEILDYDITLKEDEGRNAEILKRVMESVAEKLSPGYGYEVNICGALEICEFKNENLGENLKKIQK